MKELEQNMRKSALWRVWGLWIFVLALSSTYLFANHQLYASNGVGDLEKLREKIELDKKSWLAKKEDLEKLKLQLRKELKECKEDNDPSEKIADCEDAIELIDDETRGLNLDLTLCQANLRAAKANN